MSDIGRRALIAGAGGALIAAKAPVLTVGEPAPKFSVFTFDWKKVQFEALEGKVVILNYWATWCAPCREELPALNTYYQRHARQDLLIFAVDAEDDPPQDTLVALSKILAFPLVKHLNGKGYGIIGGAVPSNYVIDRAGVIRYAAAGAFDAQSLESTVTPLLAEPAPAAAPSTQTS